MRTLWNVALREYKRLLHQPIYWFGLILAPLFCCLFFTTLMWQGLPTDLPMGVVDEDNTPTTRKLLRNLDAFQQSEIVATYPTVTEARRAMHDQPLGLIVVDYLQLMQAANNHNGNRVQEVSEISRGLKLIARELNVPLIALSQLSRSVESRTPPIPQLADLRESGSIEQDADLVSFIYRPGYYEPDNPEVQNITDLIIAKHRNGPTGKVQLYFHPERLRFMSLDRRHE